MKKIFTTLALCAAAAVPAFALTPTYKGFGEMQTGYAIPSGKFYDGGAMYGLATSHGVSLFDGLFVGLGAELDLTYYTEHDYHEDDTDYSALAVLFAEGRYKILRTKRVSPFVGLRLGGGFNGIDEEGCFYFSPAAGCTFDLTERFGFDASIGYELFTGGSKDWQAGNINCIAFRIGVHF